MNPSPTPSVTRRLRNLLACLGILCLVPTQTGFELAAQETIASDRPGIGSGSFVLGPGTLQMETGGEYAEAGDASQYSLGQLLFRFGAFEGLELHAQLNSLVLARSEEEDREGLQDSGLGAKLRVLQAGPLGSSLSLLGSVSFPSGADFLTSDEAVPFFTLLADVPLSPGVGLAVNLGIAGLLADAEDVTSLIVTPAVSLPGDSGIGVFAAYAGFFADSGRRHLVEGGVTWVPGADLQLDVNGGVDTESGDFFLGLGLATRWFF